MLNIYNPSSVMCVGILVIEEDYVEKFKLWQLSFVVLHKKKQGEIYSLT